MKEDKEGFLYPNVDETKCVDCGACERTCPILNVKKKQPFQQKAYIVQNKDESVLRESTAGGAFTAIAKYVLQNDGVVFGVELNKNIVAQYIYITKIADIYKFRNSKYVQSLLVGGGGRQG